MIRTICIYILLSFHVELNRPGTYVQISRTDLSPSSVVILNTGRTISKDKRRPRTRFRASQCIETRGGILDASKVVSFETRQDTCRREPLEARAAGKPIGQCKHVVKRDKKKSHVATRWRLWCLKCSGNHPELFPATFEPKQVRPVAIIYRSGHLESLFTDPRACLRFSPEALPFYEFGSRETRHRRQEP